MKEEIIADNSFCANKFCEDFFTKGVYSFYDANLKSLVTKNNWVQIDSGVNFFGLIDSDAKSKSEEIILKNLSEVFNLTIRKTSIFYGIDGYSDVWHTDEEEKMFCQSLCYQEDLLPKDGGILRLKCLDKVERYFHPKNGSVVIINHKNSIEHKVDKIVSDIKRIVINSVFE